MKSLLALVCSAQLVSNSQPLPKHFVVASHGFDHHVASKNNTDPHIVDKAKLHLDRLSAFSPEECRRRLGVIFDKIDKDRNGLLAQDELSSWIQRMARNSIEVGTRKKWDEHNVFRSKRLSWHDYRKSVYGLPMHWDEDKLPQENSDGLKLNEILRADRRRWLAADQDGDDALDLKEFEAFVFPEEKTHMAEVVAMETLESVDRNHNGVVDLAEYIEDIFPGMREDPLPDYVREEIDLFRNRRDANGDGVLDVGEMLVYARRSENDHPAAEALHLMHSADTNGDGLLSKDEVLQQYDLFFSNQVTDYGNAILKPLSMHDEF